MLSKNVELTTLILLLKEEIHSRLRLHLLLLIRKLALDTSQTYNEGFIIYIATQTTHII